jgi:hypothetical protein
MGKDENIDTTINGIADVAIASYKAARHLNLNLLHPMQ